MEKKKHPNYERDESWRYLMPNESENRVYLEGFIRGPESAGQSVAKSIGVSKYPLEKR